MNREELDRIAGNIKAIANTLEDLRCCHGDINREDGNTILTCVLALESVANGIEGMTADQ